MGHTDSIRVCVWVGGWVGGWVCGRAQACAVRVCLRVGGRAGVQACWFVSGYDDEVGTRAGPASQSVVATERRRVMRGRNELGERGGDTDGEGGGERTGLDRGSGGRGGGHAESGDDGRKDTHCKSIVCVW